LRKKGFLKKDQLLSVRGEEKRGPGRNGRRGGIKINGKDRKKGEKRTC